MLSFLENIWYLTIYLDLVRVPLPEWLLDQVDHTPHHKKKMTVAKQFGSLGKKFRKNLAKITLTGSFKSKDTVDYSRYVYSEFINSNVSFLY